MNVSVASLELNTGTKTPGCMNDNKTGFDEMVNFSNELKRIRAACASYTRLVI